MASGPPQTEVENNLNTGETEAKQPVPRVEQRTEPAPQKGSAPGGPGTYFNNLQKRQSPATNPDELRERQLRDIINDAGRYRSPPPSVRNAAIAAKRELKEMQARQRAADKAVDLDNEYRELRNENMRLQNELLRRQLSK
jgi:hypothetical protein